MMSLCPSSAISLKVVVIAALLISNVNSLAPGSSSRGCRSSTWLRDTSWQRLPSAQIPLVIHDRPLGCTRESKESAELSTSIVKRRSFLCQIAFAVPAILAIPSQSNAVDSPNNESASKSSKQAPFHSAAYGREEYTNSIVASRDTNISPKEVYDTISSEFLKEAFDAAIKERGESYVPRALDVGSGAGVSTEVLYNLGYHEIDALDWSGSAWEKYIVEDPSGYCPSSVSFYELDDERYLDKWRQKYTSNQPGGKFDVIIFNFAVNDSKAALFAKELLNEKHGRLLAPINTSNDYWLKQTYKVMNSKGDVLWDAIDVGAWSVQFQPDVTQDTCSGIWCAPFNGFQKKK